MDWLAIVAFALGVVFTKALDLVSNEVEARRRGREADARAVRERLRNERLEAISQTQQMVLVLSDWVCVRAAGDRLGAESLRPKIDSSLRPLADMRLVGDGAAATQWVLETQRVMQIKEGHLRPEDVVSVTAKRTDVLDLLRQQRERVLADQEPLMSVRLDPPDPTTTPPGRTGSFGAAA